MGDPRGRVVLPLLYTCFYFSFLSSQVNQLTEKLQKAEADLNRARVSADELRDELQQRNSQQEDLTRLQAQLRAAHAERDLLQRQLDTAKRVRTRVMRLMFVVTWMLWMGPATLPFCRLSHVQCSLMCTIFSRLYVDLSRLKTSNEIKGVDLQPGVCTLNMYMLQLLHSLVLAVIRDRIYSMLFLSSFSWLR